MIREPLTLEAQLHQAKTIKELRARDQCKRKALERALDYMTLPGYEYNDKYGLQPRSDDEDQVIDLIEKALER